MLGYLIASGMGCKQIAQHEEIASTPSAVRRKAQRLGFALRGRSKDLVSAEILHVFDREAVRYDMTGSGLFRRFLEEATAQPDLIHNVVDIEL